MLLSMKRSFKVLKQHVDDITPTRETWWKGNREEACDRVPDIVMDAHAIYGAPNECARKTREFRSAGICLSAIIFVWLGVEEALELGKNW